MKSLFPLSPQAHHVLGYVGPFTVAMALGLAIWACGDSGNSDFMMSPSQHGVAGPRVDRKDDAQSRVRPMCLARRPDHHRLP